MRHTAETIAGIVSESNEQRFLVTDETGEVIEVPKSQLHLYESHQYPWGDAMVVNFEQGEDNE